MNYHLGADMGATYGIPGPQGMLGSPFPKPMIYGFSI